MIRRRCTEGSCKNGRKCLEHLRFDVMYQGNRYRIPANEFAIPRMEPGKQRPIQSMEEARDWERRFIGEIKGGPRPARYAESTEEGQHGDSERLSATRCILGTLREACGASKRGHSAKSDRRAEDTSRLSVVVVA